MISLPCIDSKIIGLNDRKRICKRLIRYLYLVICTYTPTFTREYTTLILKYLLYYMADALRNRGTLLLTLSLEIVGFNQLKEPYANDEDSGEIWVKCLHDHPSDNFMCLMDS